MKSKNFVKKSIAFLTILFTFLPSSFPKAGLIIEPTCNDECSYYGQPCPDGGTCGNYDSDPCLECPTITPPSCTNECSYIGQRTCYGSNYYKVCGNYDSDSCLEWSSIQYCPSGYICQNGECVYQPPSCQDECSYYGQTEKRCSGNYVQQRTCGYYDSDSCLEWSNWENETYCGESGWTSNYRCSSSRYLEREYVQRGCSNAQCYANSEWRQVQDCGTDSWTDNYRCSGNWVQREKIKKGCSENSCYTFSQWENIKDCSLEGKICQSGQCIEPNDIPRGTLTVSSSTEPCAGQYVTFTISAQDLQGVEKVCLNDDCQSCGFQTSCTKYWQIKKDNPGTYTFSGKIYGKKPDGSQEIVSTDPSSICVTWKDCNRPPIANAGPDKEVLETQSIVLEGSGSDPDSDPITFSWTCSGGTLSNSNIAQPTFTAPAVDSDTQIACTLTVRDSKGAQASDSMQILVKAQTLSVTLEAIPSSGSAPLTGVDLKATVSGTAIGPINYKFDCTSDGTWEYEFSGISDNPKLVVDACNYQTGGTYNAKVYVERGAAPPAWAQATILVSSPYPVVDLKVNGSDGPITIPYNSSVTLSWTSNNVNSCYASGDWSGSKAVSGTETISGILSQKTFTITCSGPGGTASDNVVVYVSLPSFSVSLSANPSSGCAPLNNVSLTANVSRDFSGNLTYYFDCTSDGSFESIQTTSQNSFTASNLCSFSNIGTFFAKVRVEGAGMSREASVPINVYSCYQPPTYPAPSVDLKVNGQDDSVTVLSGSSITLSWTSANANYCIAYGDWSGTKSVFGSESITNITSSKIYTISCSGPGGQAADSVRVYVQSAAGIFSRKLVKNLSDGTDWQESVFADPQEVLIFAIQVSAQGSDLENVIVKDTLPQKLSFKGNLKLDGQPISGDIFQGINIGKIEKDKTRTITYEAWVAPKTEFVQTETTLSNLATITSGNLQNTAKANVIVRISTPTTIKTGLTNNIFVDSFVLPLSASALLVWLLRARILQLEKFVDERKRQYAEYKAQKLLQLKIAQLKLKDKLSKI